MMGFPCLIASVCSCVRGVGLARREVIGEQRECGRRDAGESLKYLLFVWLKWLQLQHAYFGEMKETGNFQIGKKVEINVFFLCFLR